MPFATVRATGGNYDNMIDAEATEQTDLTVAAEIMDFQLGDFLDDPGATLTIAGWTPTTAFYVDLVADDDHGGQRGAGSYRFRRSVGSGSSNAIVSTDYHTRYRGIQVECAEANGAFNSTAISFSFVNNNPDAARVERCLIYYTGSVGGGRKWGLDFGSRDGVRVSATIVDSWDSTDTDDGGGINMHTSDPSWVYVCTIVNCNRGLVCNGNDGVAKGNIMSDSRGDDMQGTFNTGTGVTEFNQTSDTTAIGDDTEISQTFPFVDAASDDYLLSSAHGGGLDLSGDGDYAVTLDVTNVTITSPYDAGAHQFAGASAIPTLVMAPMQAA